MGDATTARAGTPRALTAFLIFSAALAFGVMRAAPASAAIEAEHKLLDLHNDARVDADRRPFRLDEDLSRIARAHSRHMADDGFIYHTSTDSLIRKLSPFDWENAGENVGMGSSMVRLNNAFMASTAHRANVLRQSFRKVGVGVVWDDGMAFVTVIFLDP